MNHRNIRIKLVSLALAAPAMVLAHAGCSKEPDAAKQKGGQQQPTPETVVVSVQPATIMPLQRSVDVVGTLYGDEETVISAKVAGRVTKIFGDVGDRVAPGAALAELDKIDYELSRAQRELAVRQALSQLGLQEFPAEPFDPEQ